ADRLLLVEVLTPSGNWSSWPPHKHDVDDMPAEAVLEEVYCYRFRRRQAWGVQRIYRRPDSPATRESGPRDALFAVRHGDVAIVLQPQHRPAEEARPLDRCLGGACRRQSPGRVAGAVFERLGNLDPGRDRVRPAASREVLPRLERIVVAADAAQQAGTMGNDPLPIDPHDRRRSLVIAVRLTRPRRIV